MYKILVVDDEILIRQGIIAQLKFLGYEFEEVSEADNGKSALEITCDKEPDIVITDISMPIMDGLSFIQKAKELKKGTKFILLSGYAEFAYAKQAISLGISEYLLKPVSNSSLKESLDKVFFELERERMIKSDSVHKNILSREKNEYIFEKEFNLLLQNKESGSYPFLTSNYPEFFAETESKELIFVLGIIGIDSESYDKGSFSLEENELLRFSVKNVFNEIKTKSNKIIVNNLLNNNELFILFSSEDEKRLRKEIEKVFLRMQSILEKNMDIILSFGISRPASLITERCKNQAEKALNQRILYGSANIYFYEDMKIVPMENFPMSEITGLENYVKRKDKSKIKKAVEKIFSEEFLIKYGIDYLHVMWTRILNLLLRNFDNYEEGDIEPILSGFSKIERFENINELRKYLNSMIETAIKTNDDKEKSIDEKISEAALYIQNNFYKDISINDIAERYGLNTNYFSSMFKKKMNCSAINFLTELRINAAKEYLKNTDENVADISRKVGYEDTQYFFRVFKKSENITPLMYRKLEKK